MSVAACDCGTARRGAIIAAHPGTREGVSGREDRAVVVEPVDPTGVCPRSLRQESDNLLGDQAGTGLVVVPGEVRTEIIGDERIQVRSVIRVGERVLHASCLISAEYLIDWRPRTITDISAADFELVFKWQPEILLLDEPLSNLDANLREEMRFEIRRLHEAFGITTLYVTHDQAEAMVISDRVAVLHRGRVEQVGTAQDLFRRPRTRFVAEFIGRTNLLDAIAAEPGVAVRGALKLRLASREPTSTAPVVVSIRPHEIELVTGERTAPAGANVLAGTVQRTSYLGDAVDYQVSVTGTDIVLRVTAPPPARVGPGDSVTLAVAPEACVPLTGGADGEEPGSAG